ncbi:MAG: hypothetical protein NTV23_15770 [Propionibacteriales bacterium]|nr:hypothetical protein [Propionibacteriales bacterium]
MTQKRIVRAQARGAARERDLLLRDAFRAAWADNDDAVADLLGQLVERDPDLTADQLFGMVTTLLEEVTDLSGETREAVLARLQRD